MTQVRFMTHIFSRIKIDSSSGDRIKNYYLSTAEETPHQDGILSLFWTIHKFIVGEGLTIFGSKQPSIFELDANLCKKDALKSFDNMILSLLFQISYIYQNGSKYSKEDCEAVLAWTKDLRHLQLDSAKKHCAPT